MEPKFSVTCEQDAAKVELCGRLDATNSPMLQEELKKLIGKSIKNLIFYAKDLEYISSAGLRVIIFGKQKLGVDTHVFLIGAPEAVVSVVKMSGLDNFLTIQDTY